MPLQRWPSRDLDLAVVSELERTTAGALADAELSMVGGDRRVRQNLGDGIDG